jgi:hypothetical protein
MFFMSCGPLGKHINIQEPFPCLVLGIYIFIQYLLVVFFKILVYHLVSNGGNL